MEEKAIQLLEQLAKQMGTTIEYLWAVLIKQAYVTAITNFVFILFEGLLIFFTYKFHKQSTRKVPGKEEYTYYEEDDEWRPSLLIALVIICIVYGIVCSFLLDTAITALFNPEYYALEKILRTIK